MATKARKSFGALLKIGDGNVGSETFTTIAEVSALKSPQISVSIQDVTAHDTGPWKQKLASLLDAGQATFDMNFNNDPTQGFGTGLYNDMVNMTLRNFQLVIPTTVPKTCAFSAYVTAFPLDLPVDGVIKTSITLEVSGQPTWS